MSGFEKLRRRAMDAAAEHAGKVREGTQRAGDKLNERTGGKYQDKIDKARRKVVEQVDRAERERDQRDRRPPPQQQPGRQGQQDQWPDNS